MFVFKTLRTFFYFVAFLVIIQLKGINATQLISTNDLYFDPFSEFKGTKVFKIIHFWTGFEDEKILRAWFWKRINELGDSESVLLDPVLADWATKLMKPRKKELDLIKETSKFTHRRDEFLKMGGEYVHNFKPKPETLNEMVLYFSRLYYGFMEKYSPEITSWIWNKLTAKLFVRDVVGAKYPAHLYGAFENLEDVFAPDFWNSLPRRFVVKGVSGCWGAWVRVVDKNDKATVEALQSLADTKSSRVTRARYIVEEYLPSLIEGRTVTDYKFFCSFGKIICVVVGNSPSNPGPVDPLQKFQSIHTVPGWHHLNLTYYNLKSIPIEKPALLNEMMEVAQKLSKMFPLVRIDLYLTKNSKGQLMVKVGEITTRAAGGKAVMKPVYYDLLFGSLVRFLSPAQVTQLLDRDVIFIDKWTARLKRSPDPFHDIVVPGFHIDPQMVIWDSRTNAIVEKQKTLQALLRKSTLSEKGGN
ncbi:MAG: hypothetical protein LBJ77_01440 [Holosporales bacterium]|jgi:hypothetical protein|nr:hypothetical protein [Holosporales bacterium]